MQLHHVQARTKKHEKHFGKGCVKQSQKERKKKKQRGCRESIASRSADKTLISEINYVNK